MTVNSREIAIPIPTRRNAYYPLQVTSYPVQMHGLAQSLDGLTIAHLTDLHAGFAALEPVYETMVQTVNDANVDLVLLTGDYIDDSVKRSEYPIQNYLCRLHARLGIYGCLGNHDHRRGAAKTRRMLEDAGVRALVNDNVEVAENLWVAGIDDVLEGKPDVERTFTGVPADRTALFLSHQPPMIERVSDRDVFQLSGHTHGAQFVLPFPSPKMICWFHLRSRQVAGWYSNGKARVYVSRGVGVTGQPFRIKCPAEIPFYHLQSDSGNGAE